MGGSNGVLRIDGVDSNRDCGDIELEADSCFQKGMMGGSDEGEAIWGSAFIYSM